MKKEKTYRRIVRRRLEAALALRMQPNAKRVKTTIAPLMEPVPPEVVDLATGPFQARFPELAKRPRG